jgi:hypothetical protein
MNFEELKNNCKNGMYENKMPYMKKIRDQPSFFDSEQKRIDNLFYKHCCESVETLLNPIICYGQFQLLFNKAWKEKHSEGIYAVIEFLEELTYWIYEWERFNKN